MANVVEILIRAREEVSKALGRVSQGVKSAAGAATRAGGAFGKLSGQFSNLGASLSQVSPVLGNFFRLLTNPVVLAVAAIGGLVVGFKRMISSTAETQDAIAKMSKRIGVSVEDLSSLRLAAKLSGTSVEQMGEALRFLNKNMLDASRGTGIAKDFFIEFGIAIEDAGGKTRKTMDVFLDVAEVVSKIEDAGRAGAVAGKLLGERYGPQLVPLLREGKAGISALIAEAERAGIVFDESTAAASERMNDAFARLGFTFEGLKFTLANALIPVLADFVEGLNEAILTMRDAAREGASLLSVLQGIQVTFFPTRLQQFDEQLANAQINARHLREQLAGIRAPEGLEAGVQELGIDFTLSADLNEEQLREEIKKAEAEVDRIVEERRLFRLGRLGAKALSDGLNEVDPIKAKQVFDDLFARIQTLGPAANVFEQLAQKIDGITRSITKQKDILGKPFTTQLRAELERVTTIAEATVLEQVKLQTLLAEGNKEEAAALQFEIDKRKALKAATEEQRQALLKLAEAQFQARLKATPAEKAQQRTDISTRVQILRLQLEGVGANKEEGRQIRLKIIDIKEELALQNLVAKAKREKRDITKEEREELRLQFEVQRRQIQIGEELVLEAKSQQEVLTQVTADTITSMRTTLGDFFDRFFRGELENAEELWVNFWNSLVRIASDATAQILIDTLVGIGNTQRALQTGGAGGGGGILDFFLGFLGLGKRKPGDPGLSFAQVLQLPLGFTAEGAVVRRPELRVLGEAGPEIVVPLTRKPRPEVVEALTKIVPKLQEGGVVAPRVGAPVLGPTGITPADIGGGPGAFTIPFFLGTLTFAPEVTRETILSNIFGVSGTGGGGISQAAAAGLAGIAPQLAGRAAEETVDLGFIEFALKRARKELPRLGDGAVIRGPILAEIGEAGPEVVVPLTRKPKPEVMEALASIAVPMQEGGVVGRSTMSLLDRGQPPAPPPITIEAAAADEGPGDVTVINLFDRRELERIVAQQIAGNRAVIVNDFVQGMRGNSVVRRTSKKFAT